MMNRRTLLGGAAALAASSLAGCSSKFRTYDGPPVTGIVVNKAPRRMHLLSGNSLLRSFEIEAHPSECDLNWAAERQLHCLPPKRSI